MGDADIGDGVNIGAGTITCNYDGVNKHRTVVEDRAFIGSDTMLVAPIRVGKKLLRPRLHDNERCFPGGSGHRTRRAEGNNRLGRRENGEEGENLKCAE